MARALALLSLLAVLAAALYAAYLDHTIRTWFEGQRWPLASRVYARPLELHGGAGLSAEDFARELERLRYRADAGLGRAGTVVRRGRTFRVRTRSFRFWDGDEPARDLRLVFSESRLRAVQDARSGKPVGAVRLDPPWIANIYPDDREDRILAQLADVPPLLQRGLVAVEDRGFYRHRGVDPRAIGRALLANLRAGAVVQGGSTLTQQLAKNAFLSSRQTLGRKLKEALMALLLELRYGKEEILEAYLNEVYLGQDGARSIHGVGLASRFYYDRPLRELDLPQVALLVALVRGPSLYDPRRQPDRARERRNRVLSLLAERGVVSAAEARAAQQRPLGVTPAPSRGRTRHPAFLDLVRRQLHRDYAEADLRSEGLRIFTTLDPRVQEGAESAVAEQLGALERRRGLSPGKLEAAMVVVGPQTGEVLAVVGGRAASYPGFNRALDATRPIGSLVKPAVYLTALERPEAYSLATLVQDAPITVESEDGRPWSPLNHDRRSRGPVTLYAALVGSLNLATVHLGLDLGVSQVLTTLRRLGVERAVPAYPSVLLGAVELAPVEVTQMYQTLAGGGFHSPLRAIREVMDAAGQPLRRYPLAVRRTVDEGAVFLVDAALQGAVREGTAKALADRVPRRLGVAGKTGTTDGLRDSWFAGFTGNWLAVAWVGRDDNRPTGLTGASGALTLWAELFERIGGEPLNPIPPAGAAFAWVDRRTGLRCREGWNKGVRLPFLRGTAPPGRAPDPEPEPAGLWSRLQGWFQRRTR